MPGRTRAGNQLDTQDSVNAIYSIFDQVQNTSANHQKNIVALHRLFVNLSQLRGRNSAGDTILIGERKFEQAMFDIILRVLQFKKGAAGDRVAKFFGGFMKCINEKSGQDPIDPDDFDGFDVAYTPAARFTERLLKNVLLKGLGAKEKTVRFRIIQLCSELVFNLGEIDTDIYYQLRDALLNRIKDKEWNIRMQAGIGLCKFYGIDEPEDLRENNLEPLSEVLFESLACDNQGEVRRAILVNLPLNKTTIPLILERTRDVEEKTRKLTYTVLETNVTTMDDENNQVIGFAHPKVLSIEQREMIIRNGLGDRDATVRAAAVKLIEKWVETADMTSKDQENGDEPQGLIGLLKLFDLCTDKLVADAIIRLFESDPRHVDDITFGDNYWSTLTPETAFLVRICVDYYKGQIEQIERNDAVIAKAEARLEAILPVVTSFAFRLQEHFNALVEGLRYHGQVASTLDDEARVLQEDDLADKKFMVIEMLKIAISLDYGDEIGRRKMDSLIRKSPCSNMAFARADLILFEGDMLTHDFLPEDLVPPCMEVMTQLSTSERDLIRVVAIEVVQSLRDPGDNEDEDAENQQDVDPDASFESEAPVSTPTRQKNAMPKPREEMSEAERAHADKIDKRCLCICQSMLERVNGTLENNSSLDGIVKELIYPAVQRKDNESRIQGFRCLGLISLISKNIANMALPFFIKQMKIDQNPEDLRVIILQVVFDILMKYGQAMMVEPYSSAAWVGHFTELLEREETSEEFRAVLCMGLAKLALPAVLVDAIIMKLLLIDFFSPQNIKNQKLKQCLSFFFQAYCASSLGNQEMISSLFSPVFCELCDMNSKLDDGEEMASMGQIAGIILDWTHPKKLYCLHIDIARDIIKELLNSDSKLFKEHKKVLCQLLSKLHLPEVLDEDKAHFVNLLLDKVPSCRPLGDAVSKNAFSKFQVTFNSKYEKQLEGLSAEEYLSLEKHQAEAQFLNDIIPLDDLSMTTRRGRKRRSGSVTSSAAEEEPSTSKNTRGRKAKAKRARLSTSDNESDEDSDRSDHETEHGSPPASRHSSVAPTRTMPKRQATRRAPVDPITISSDSEQDTTPRNQRPLPTLNTKREDQDDSNSEHVSQATGHSDSEEEDEVSGLLVDE
ncbi:nuclear condensing complex subunit [Lentinula raphanica]|nr:nuclear condensing complex subunit [Lentinula raphanica]